MTLICVVISSSYLQGCW